MAKRWLNQYNKTNGNKLQLIWLFISFTEVIMSLLLPESELICCFSESPECPMRTTHTGCVIVSLAALLQWLRGQNFSQSKLFSILQSWMSEGSSDVKCESGGDQCLLQQGMGWFCYLKRLGVGRQMVLKPQADKFILFDTVQEWVEQNVLLQSNKQQVICQNEDNQSIFRPVLLLLFTLTGLYFLSLFSCATLLFLL